MGLIQALEYQKSQELSRQNLIAQMRNDPVIRAALPYMPTLQKVMGIDSSQMGGTGAIGNNQPTLDMQGLPAGSSLLTPGGTPETATPVGAGSALDQATGGGGGGGGSFLSRLLGSDASQGSGGAGRAAAIPDTESTSQIPTPPFAGTPPVRGGQRGMAMDAAAGRTGAFTGGPGYPTLDQMTQGAPGAPGAGGPGMAGGGGDYGVPGVPQNMMNPPTLPGMSPRVLTSKDIPILDFYRKMNLMHQLGGGGGFGGMPMSGGHVDWATGDLKTDYAPGKFVGVPKGTFGPGGAPGGDQGMTGGGQEGVSGAPGASQAGGGPLPPLPGTPGTPGPPVTHTIGPAIAAGGRGAGTMGGQPITPPSQTYANDPETASALSALGLSVPKSPGLQSSAGGTAGAGPTVISPRTRTQGNVTTYEQPEDMKPEYYALGRLAAKSAEITQMINQEGGSYGQTLARHPELQDMVEKEMVAEKAEEGAVGQVTKDTLSHLATVRQESDNLKSYLNSDFDQIVNTYLPHAGKGLLGGAVGYAKAKANVIGTALKSQSADSAESIGKLSQARDYIIGRIQSMNMGVKQGGLRITTPEIELFGKELDTLAEGGMTAPKAMALKAKILRELDASERSAQKEYGRYLPRAPEAGQ